MESTIAPAPATKGPADLATCGYLPGAIVVVLRKTFFAATEVIQGTVTGPTRRKLASSFQRTGLVSSNVATFAAVHLTAESTTARTLAIHKRLKQHIVLARPMLSLTALVGRHHSPTLPWILVSLA